MCARRYGNEGLKITFSQSTGTTRPLTISKPCGVCIQLLEARIQVADMSVPIATMTVAKKCRPCPTLFHPNSITPRNPASRKKAASHSDLTNRPALLPPNSHHTPHFLPH